MGAGARTAMPSDGQRATAAAAAVAARDISGYGLGGGSAPHLRVQRSVDDSVLDAHTSGLGLLREGGGGGGTGGDGDKDRGPTAAHAGAALTTRHPLPQQHGGRAHRRAASGDTAASGCSRGGRSSASGWEWRSLGDLALSSGVSSSVATSTDREEDGEGEEEGAGEEDDEEEGGGGAQDEKQGGRAERPQLAAPSGGAPATVAPSSSVAASTPSGATGIATASTHSSLATSAASLEDSGGASEAAAGAGTDSGPACRAVQCNAAAIPSGAVARAATNVTSNAAPSTAPTTSGGSVFYSQGMGSLAALLLFALGQEEAGHSDSDRAPAGGRAPGSAPPAAAESRHAAATGAVPCPSSQHADPSSSVCAHHEALAFACLVSLVQRGVPGLFDAQRGGVRAACALADELLRACDPGVHGHLLSVYGAASSHADLMFFSRVASLWARPPLASAAALWDVILAGGAHWVPLMCAGEAVLRRGELLGAGRNAITVFQGLGRATPAAAGAFATAQGVVCVAEAPSGAAAASSVGRVVHGSCLPAPRDLIRTSLAILHALPCPLYRRLVEFAVAVGPPQAHAAALAAGVLAATPPTPDAEAEAEADAFEDAHNAEAPADLTAVTDAASPPRAYPRAAAAVHVTPRSARVALLGLPPRPASPPQLSSRSVDRSGHDRSAGGQAELPPPPMHMATAPPQARPWDGAVSPPAAPLRPRRPEEEAEAPLSHAHGGAARNLLAEVEAAADDEPADSAAGVQAASSSRPGTPALPRTQTAPLAFLSPRSGPPAGSGHVTHAPAPWLSRRVMRQPHGAGPSASSSSSVGASYAGAGDDSRGRGGWMVPAMVSGSEEVRLGHALAAVRQRRTGDARRRAGTAGSGSVLRSDRRRGAVRSTGPPLGHHSRGSLTATLDARTLAAALSEGDDNDGVYAHSAAIPQIDRESVAMAEHVDRVSRAAAEARRRSGSAGWAPRPPARTVVGKH